MLQCAGAGAGAGADARESAADAALSGLLGLLCSRSLAGSQSRVAGLTQWTTCCSIACSSVTKLTLRLRPNTHICHTILSDLTNMLVLFLFHCMYFLPHLSCRGRRDSVRLLQHPCIYPEIQTIINKHELNLF